MGKGKNKSKRRKKSNNRVYSKKEQDFRVTLYLGGHTDEGDAHAVIPFLKTAHVYAPEMACATAREVGGIEDQINAAVEGFTVGGSGNFADFFNTLLTLGGRYHARPYFLERHTADESAEMMEIQAESTVLFTQALDPLFSGRLNEAIAVYRRGLELFYGVNQRRERAIITELKKAHSNIYDRHPSLRSRKKLNLLVVLGKAHEGMVEKLAESGLQYDKHMQSPNEKKTYMHRMFLSLNSGEQPNDETVVRSIFEQFLESTMNSPLGVKVKGRVILDISEKIPFTAFQGLNFSDVPDMQTLDNYLGRFNCNFPRTREDIAHLL